MTGDSTFQYVLAGARQGDTSCQNELVTIADQAAQPLAAFCRPSARRGVSDLMQDVRIHVIESLSQFAGGSRGEFFAWVKRIFRHFHINVLRSDRRAKRDAGREEPFHDSVPARQETPSEIVQSRELGAELLAQFDRLSDTDREIIRLRLYENLEYEAIGRRLNIQADAARRRYGRAMKHWQGPR